MLKNKKAIYVLVPLNIVIWVYLGYSIYDGLKQDDVPLTESGYEGFKKEAYDGNSVYTLSLNYSDPFLKTKKAPKVYQGNNSSENINNTVKNYTIKPTVPTVAKPATEVKYLGLVKNNATGAVSAIVSINGKSFVVKKGETAEGVFIKDISADLIEIKEGKVTSKVIKN